MSTKESSNSALLKGLVWSFSSKVPAAISEIDLKIWRVLGKYRQICSFPCATEERENTAGVPPGQQESLLVYDSPELHEGEASDKEVVWGNSHAPKAVLSGQVTQHRRVLFSTTMWAISLYKMLFAGVCLGVVRARVVSVKGSRHAPRPRCNYHSFGSGHRYAGGASLAELHWLLWSWKIL